LADFGAEHSFEASCKRVKEQYGFDINTSAVRIETLRPASRMGTIEPNPRAGRWRRVDREKGGSFSSLQQS